MNYIPERNFFVFRPTGWMLFFMFCSVLFFPFYSASAVLGFVAGVLYVLWRKPGDGTSYGWLLFPWPHLLFGVDRIWYFLWLVIGLSELLMIFAIRDCSFEIYVLAQAIMFIAAEGGRFAVRLLLRADGIKHWRTTNLF